MKKQALTVLAASALALGGILPAAHADSVSGQATGAAQDCSGISTNADVVNPLGAVTTVISEGAGGLGGGVGTSACETDAGNLAGEQAGFGVDNALAAADEAQSVADDPGSVVAPLAGQLLSMYASTVNLQFALSTDYMNQKLFLTPVVFGGLRSADFANSPSGFSYNTDAHLYWDPNSDSGSNGHLDGDCIYTVFQQSKRYVSGVDFWATSQDGSVTPLKGSHITHIDVNITPNDNTEIINSDPNSVSPYGNAGSRTINASLNGEWSSGGSGGPGGGGSVGIAQTWNYAVGYAGGGRLSSGQHKAEWDQGHSSDKYAKSAQGVETWKVPVNESVFWYIGSYAHWHS